ncbi:MAG TPA: Fis family transcriptional regulator [bacterium]|nr:Fis family transcriptional regulator [bacterium]
MSQSKVCHKGKVVNINEATVSVRIEVMSACSKCHAKGICSAADMSEKIIECISNDSFNKGDEVMVEMATKFGFKAVVYAFFIPFLIVVGVLLLTLPLTGSETVAAFISFAALVPYYLAIYFMKDHFSKNFFFTCRKINNNE